MAKTTTPAKNAVAVKPTNAAVATQDAIPDFMKGQRGLGTENLGQGDIETPRLKLLQAVSPEVEEFDEARPGHFWHSIAECSLGAELRVVPLYIDMRAILWRPRHEGGGILARADDGMHWSPPNATFEVRPYKDRKDFTVKWITKPTVAASGLLDWGSSDPSDSGSQPAATRMYNMAVALPDFPELGIGVVTLQRASISVARKFLGKLKLMSVPSFGCYFNMSSVKNTGAGGDSFNNYKFVAAGHVQDEDEFNAYRELYEAFKAAGLNIKDLEGVQDDGVTIEGTADTGTGPKY